MEGTSPGDPPIEALDAEETYHHVLLYFIQSLRILATDPELQCNAKGNFDVAQELKNEILPGRYLIGKGRLHDAEESAVAALNSAVAAVPDSAPTFCLDAITCAGSFASGPLGLANRGESGVL
jgi:hypothetical protein